MSLLPVSTFSIVARDASTRSLGVAVQSRYFNVGAVVPWAEAGVGAVATQAFVDPGYGPRGLELMRRGASAGDALEKLLAGDPQREIRQVALLDAQGGTAAHTGTACVPHASHRARAGRSVQGNMLATEEVTDAMDAAYRATRAPFAERLVAALHAGQRAGGDLRGMQSSALLVVQPVSAEEPWLNRVMDLRVDDHADPIEELGRLLRMRSAMDCMAKAEQRMLTGKMESAKRALEQGLERSNQHDEFLFWGGIGLTKVGQEKEGLRLLKTAIRKNPRWRTMLERMNPALRPPPAVLAELARPDPGRN